MLGEFNTPFLTIFFGGASALIGILQALAVKLVGATPASVFMNPVTPLTDTLEFAVGLFPHTFLLVFLPEGFLLSLDAKDFAASAKSATSDTHGNRIGIRLEGSARILILRHIVVSVHLTSLVEVVLKDMGVVGEFFEGSLDNTLFLGISSTLTFHQLFALSHATASEDNLIHLLIGRNGSHIFSPLESFVVSIKRRYKKSPKKSITFSRIFKIILILF
jgi:hypothetical protein